MRNFSSVRVSSTPLTRVTALVAFTAALALPAQAQLDNAAPNHLAYDYQNGSFTAEAEINPLAGRLLGNVLKKEVPSSINFSATELAGSFTLPEAAANNANLGNGDITLDSAPVKAFLEPYLEQALDRIVQNYDLPEGVSIETLESVVNYRVIGKGRLESAQRQTAFTFDYSDRADSLTIKGIDPAVLALCQVQECSSQVEGDVDLQLDVKGISETSDELGIKLPANIKQALKRAQMFGLKEVAFADGKLTSRVQVLPRPAQSTDDAVPDLIPGVDMPGAKLPPSSTLPSSPKASTSSLLHQLTHGNFVLTAERLTAPWSVVFALPSR